MFRKEAVNVHKTYTEDFMCQCRGAQSFKREIKGFHTVVKFQGGGAGVGGRQDVR